MPLGEQRGGGEMMLLELLRNASLSGITWKLVVFEEGSIVDQAREIGIETTIVSAGRLRHLHRYLQTVAAVRAVAADADLVFSWMTKAHFYGAPAALLAGVPSAWFQLGIPSRRSWSDRLATLLPAKGVVTLSRRAERAQAALYPRRPTRMVYPSVNLERFIPKDPRESIKTRRALGLPDLGPIVGVVARLQRWKGIDVAIEALPAVKKAFPQAVLVVVGGSHFSEPDYEEQLHAHALRLGVGDSVILAGLQRDVPVWMSAMDVLVHPAYDEPFGIAVIEAMAMAMPGNC